jgi:hypothetical protein
MRGTLLELQFLGRTRSILWLLDHGYSVFCLKANIGEWLAHVS